MASFTNGHKTKHQDEMAAHDKNFGPAIETQYRETFFQKFTQPLFANFCILKHAEDFLVEKSCYITSKKGGPGLNKTGLKRSAAQIYRVCCFGK